MKLLEVSFNWDDEISCVKNNKSNYFNLAHIDRGNKVFIRITNKISVGSNNYRKHAGKG